MIAKKKRNRKKNAIEEKGKKLTKGVIKTKNRKRRDSLFCSKITNALHQKKGTNSNKMSQGKKKQRGYSKQINKKQLLLE